MKGRQLALGSLLVLGGGLLVASVRGYPVPLWAALVVIVCAPLFALLCVASGR